MEKGSYVFACLVPVVAVALSMEVLGLYDDWLSLGQLRWMASLHDIINTSLWPVVITILVHIRAIKESPITSIGRRMLPSVALGVRCPQVLCGNQCYS